MYRKETSLSGLPVDDVLLYVAVVPHQIVNDRMLNIMCAGVIEP